MEFLKSYWSQGAAFGGGIAFEVYFEAVSKVLDIVGMFS